VHGEVNGRYPGGKRSVHALPAADITGVSCPQGEVAASVFDRYRVPLHREASFKPYIIAAMILLSKRKAPADDLVKFLETASPRVR